MCLCFIRQFILNITPLFWEWRDGLWLSRKTGKEPRSVLIGIKFVKSVKVVATSWFQIFRVLISRLFIPNAKQMPLYRFQILLETFYLCYFEPPSPLSVPWCLLSPCPCMIFLIPSLVVSNVFAKKFCNSSSFSSFKILTFLFLVICLTFSSLWYSFVCME